MARIEDMVRKFTDEKWEIVISEMEAVFRGEKDEQLFVDTYGCKPGSMKAYAVQHNIELEIRNKMLMEQRQELLSGKTDSEMQKKVDELQGTIDKLLSFPPIKPMTGKCVKANFYATEEALELFNKVIDMVVEMYGFKRYYAVSFVLEEGIRRLGVEVDNN